MSAKEIVSWLNLGSSAIDARARKEFVFEFHALGAVAVGGLAVDALSGDGLISGSSIEFRSAPGVEGEVPFISEDLEESIRGLTDNVDGIDCLTTFVTGGVTERAGAGTGVGAGAGVGAGGGSILFERDDDDDRPACGRWDASVIGVKGVLSGEPATRSKLKGGS